MSAGNGHDDLEPIDFLQLPLAIGSFIFFKFTRQLMRGFVALHSRFRRKQPAAWRLVSSDLLKVPLSLTVMMTKAPRWNTHAQIAMAGPVDIASEFEIECEEGDSAGDAWSLVLYRLQDKTEQRLSPDNGGVSAGRYGLSTRPGRYTLVMRCYDFEDNVRFPIVRVDGRKCVDACEFSADLNSFYRDLRSRSNGFYKALNYYVYSMLKFSAYLPDAFIKSEYLPVGDPGNGFFFGTARAYTALQISVKRGVLDSFNVYFTLYDRASFPVDWRRISSQLVVTPVNEKKGFYLIRLRPKSGDQVVLESDSIVVESIEKHKQANTGHV